MRSAADWLQSLARNVGFTVVWDDVMRAWIVIRPQMRCYPIVTTYHTCIGQNCRRVETSSTCQVDTMKLGNPQLSQALQGQAYACLMLLNMNRQFTLHSFGRLMVAFNE
jgi:hypothetical protein